MKNTNKRSTASSKDKGVLIAPCSEQTTNLWELFEKRIVLEDWCKYDLAWNLWYRMVEAYGVALNKEAMEDLTIGVIEGWGLDELVYEACHLYAKERGWEEVM